MICVNTFPISPSNASIGTAVVSGMETPPFFAVLLCAAHDHYITLDLYFQPPRLSRRERQRRGSAFRWVGWGTDGGDYRGGETEGCRGGEEGGEKEGEGEGKGGRVFVQNAEPVENCANLWKNTSLYARCFHDPRDQIPSTCVKPCGKLCGKLCGKQKKSRAKRDFF